MTAGPGARGLTTRGGSRTFGALRAAPLSPLRVLIVGLGRWGRNILRVLVAEPDCTVVAVADRDPENLADSAVPEGAARWRDGASAITHVDCDLVVLATGPRVHTGLGLQALRRGRHLFVEKPLALDAPSGHALFDAAEGAGTQLHVGHLLRLHPAVAEVARVVAEDAAPRRIDGERRGWDPRPPEGSCLFALAPHELSLAVELLPLRRGEVRALPLRRNERGEDVAVALWLRDDAGASLHSVLTLDEPEKLRRWTFGSPQLWFRFDDAPAPPVLRRWAGSPGRPQLHPFPADEPLRVELRAVLGSILRPAARPAVDPRDRAIFTLLLAAAESLRDSGRPIRWELQ